MFASTLNLATFQKHDITPLNPLKLQRKLVSLLSSDCLLSNTPPRQRRLQDFNKET